MSPLVSTFAGAALRPYGFTLGGAAPAAFELISTQVLTGTAATVTFSSIPSTYTHLQLRIVAKFSAASATGYSAVRFNSDSAANYSYHYLYGTGTSVASTGSAGTSFAGLVFMGANDVGASVFSSNIIDILDYKDTNKYKTTRLLGGRSQSTSPQVNLVSGNWRSTSAITSIDLPVLDGTSYSIGSRFSLYGVKGS